MDDVELGPRLSRLLKEVVRREQPILDEHGLTMWDYVVLARLDRGDAPTQAELAELTGRDKTRLIGNLDRLEADGLVTRSPDPADRRRRIVALTASGRRSLRRSRGRIFTMQDGLLEGVPAEDRAAFMRTLARLTDDDGPVAGRSG